MKPYLYTLLAAAAATGLASAQTAYTTPVGYVSLGDTVGANAFPANTDQRISIPLLNAAEFTGVIATGGISGSDITIDGAAFTPNEWVSYVAEVTSGANEGQLLQVTANTATTLTVAVIQTGDLLSGLADGDGISLSPSWTIGSLIGDQPVGTRLLAFSGTGTGINIAPDLTYEFGDPFGIFGGVNQWYNTGSLTAASTVPIFPGEGLILRTGATPIASLVATGTVSVTNSRVVIAGGAAQQDSPLGYISPVDQIIVNANIPVTVGDRILLFDPTTTGQNKAPTITYEYGDPFGIFGGVNQWYNTGSLSALTTEVIPAGASFIYRTVAAAGDTPWSSIPDFLPGL